MVVRQYRSKKYISTARVGSEIHSCYTTRGTDDEYKFEIIDATIVGVKAASTVRLELNPFLLLSDTAKMCYGTTY